MEGYLANVQKAVWFERSERFANTNSRKSASSVCMKARTDHAVRQKL